MTREEFMREAADLVPDEQRQRYWERQPLCEQMENSAAASNSTLVERRPWLDNREVTLVEMWRELIGDATSDRDWSQDDLCTHWSSLLPCAPHQVIQRHSVHPSGGAGYGDNGGDGGDG